MSLYFFHMSISIKLDGLGFTEISFAVSLSFCVAEFEGKNEDVHYGFAHLMELNERSNMNV